MCGFATRRVRRNARAVQNIRITSPASPQSRAEMVSSVLAPQHVLHGSRTRPGQTPCTPDQFSVGAACVVIPSLRVTRRRGSVQSRRLARERAAHAMAACLHSRSPLVRCLLIRARPRVRVPRLLARCLDAQLLRDHRRRMRLLKSRELRVGRREHVKVALAVSGLQCDVWSSGQQRCAQQRGVSSITRRQAHRAVQPGNSTCRASRRLVWSRPHYTAIHVALGGVHELSRRRQRCRRRH